jgi:phage replication-related protein YjqB (UPF0714/DUF867 family)
MKNAITSHKSLHFTNSVNQEDEERGCTQLEVACNQTRTASHRFYESQGLTRSHYKFAKPL